MAQNNFILNMIAGLQKTKSKQQIKADAKSLGDLYVKLIGNLDMPKTRKYIKNQLKGLNNMTFKITPTMNSKGVQNATKQTLQNAQKVANNNKIKYSFDMDKQKLKNQLKNFATENSKLFSSKEMTAKYNQLLNLSNVAKSKSELNALRKQLSAFRTELIATNKAGMTWSDKFKASIAHFAQYFSGASFIYAVTNQIRNAWTEAKTLDDSLVDLQKVTAEIEDRDSLYKYFDKALNKAQELNVKVGSLIDAISEFKKLGWTLENAELGGEWATKLSNVGDVDIETAIGSIKTAVASFDEIGGYGNDQMDKKLEAYVDLINNMSNKYSIDAQGLAESIRLSAGTLTEAHVSIEEAATMFATANKYYNDPSYLGNTAKIGSLRMRATSGDTDAIKELQEMGEEIDDLATASSTLREKLLALTGVDIMEDEHTFKSYYDQLYEIAQVIDTLDDTSRANVLETLFGKSRSAGGAAILSGMKESSDAYKDAINSAGSATQEYNTWMQSADAATQRFSNTLTATYQNFINGNTVRDIANLGSAVLEFANTWGIVEGAVKGFLALKIGTFLTNGFMAFATATKQVEQYGRALQMVNNIPNGNLSQRFSSLKGIATATASLTTAQLKQVLASKTLTQQDRIRILQMQGMTKEMVLQKLAEMNLTQATNAQTKAQNMATVSTVSFSSSVKGLGNNLKIAFMNNKATIIIMALSTIIGIVTNKVSEYNQKLEETRQANMDAATTAKEEADALNELCIQYENLSRITNRTEEQEDDFKQVVQDITKALGEKAEVLNGLTAGTDAYTKSLREATKAELEGQYATAKIGAKAAEEELAKKTYDKWSGSKVSILLNEQMTANKEHMAALNVVKETLSAYEDVGNYGVEWEPVNWDSNTDDMNAVVEYYNALIKAREEIVTDENADFLMKSDIYEDINTTINDLSASVEKYTEQQYNALKLNYEWQNGIPSTSEELKKMEDSIISASGAGKEFQGILREYLSNDFSELINVEATSNFGEGIDAISNKVLDLQSAMTLVNGFEVGDTNVTGFIDELGLLQEVLSNTGDISQETYEKLLSCSKDYATAIRTENGRITLNTNKLKQVAKQRGIDTKATIKQTLALKKQEWLQWKNKIENYNGTLLDSIETKYDDIDALQAEIAQYELLVNSLDNATSAFERFKAAQDTDDQDMYDTTQDAFNVLKEYSSDSSSENYGKYNRDEFQEAAMLLMDTDTYTKALNAKDLTEYQKVVQGFVKSISPLFDENNAKSASKLFDEVDKIVASGDVPVADQDWADRLGISKEAFNALKQLGNLYDYNNKEVFESFPLDKLDDYQEKVSNVAEEYKTLNSIEDKTSNEYLKQEQAYKQAKEKHDAFIEETTTDMSNAFTNYQKSGGMDGRTFADYVKDQFDFEDTDVTGSMFALIDKADTLKEKLNTISPNKDVQKQFAEYDELQMLVSVLDALGYKYEETANNSEKLNKSLEKTPETTRAEAFEDDMKSFEKLKEQEEMFKRQMASSTFGSEMYTDAQNGLSQVQSQLEELRGALKLKLELDISDVETKIGETEKAKQKFQQENSGLEDTIYYRGRTAGYDTELEQLNSQKDTLEQKLKIVIEGDEEAQSAIDSLSSATIEDKTFSVSANDLATTVIDKVNAQKIADKTFNITANLKVPKLDLGLGGSDSSEDTGGGGAYGTVNIGQGRAYADGNIGTDKELKNVMVGEVAPEMVVDPHSGEYTIYQNPTMLDKLPKNAIVFNGKQTKEILENGMTTSFGKAYVNGNVTGKAFKTGTKTNSIELNDVQNNNNAIKGAKNNKSSSEIAEEEAKEEKEITEEFLDWIERRVQKLQRYFDRWIKNAETALTSGFITKYYNKARKNLNKQMDVQSKAYNRYLEEANKSGLSDAYKKKVRDGLIDIEAITDDALKEQVSKYQENFDKAINSLTAFEEAAEKRFNIPLEKAAKKIEKFSDAIELLDKKLDNAIGSKDKNKLIDKQTKEEKKTLNAYKTAVKNSETNLKNQSKKMKSKDVLNSSDVSSKEKKKIKNAVKNGKEIDLSFFKEGSKAYKQAVKYNEALKANAQAQYDLNVATEEYNAWLVEASKMKFDNIADEYEYAIKQIENNFTDIDNKIAEIEAVGKRVDMSLYQSQKNLNEQELAKYKAEKIALEESLKDIKKGTAEWNDAQDKIQEVENSISNCVQETAKLNNAMTDLHYTIVSDIAEGIDRIVTEQDFLQGLFAHEKLTDDDTGNLTEAGVAKLGSLSASYFASKKKTEIDKKEVDILRNMLDKKMLSYSDGDFSLQFNSIEELEERYHQMYDLWQNDITETYNLEVDIFSVMEQKYQAELGYVKKIIDLKKEQLDSERDLYNYQREISEKTKNINTIQSQISAYSGDSSEEGRAKLQRLQKQLEDSKQDLADAEYDRQISDQQNMLDKFYTEYEEAITNQLEAFKTIVDDGLGLANDNLSYIKNYLSDVSSANGYTEQYSGLFDVNTGSINANVNTATQKIVDAINKEPTTTPDNNSGSGTSSEGIIGEAASTINTDFEAPTSTMPTIPADNTFSSIRPDQIKNEWETKRKEVEAIFGNEKYYAKGKKSKASDYKTKINQYLFEKNGKVLSNDGLKALRKVLGTNNAGLYDAMLELKKHISGHVKNVGGFKTGGIAKLIKAQGEDGIGLMRNGEGFVAPEHVPAIKELLDNIPLMNDMFKPLVEIPRMPNIAPVNNMGSNMTFGDVHYVFDMPNVVDEQSFLNTMQSSQKIQKCMRSMTIDQLSGAGRLSCKSIK